VEQAPWPRFGLFFENPNIFTSRNRNSSFTVVISLLTGKFWITFVAGTTILFCQSVHTGSETTELPSSAYLAAFAGRKEAGA